MVDYQATLDRMRRFTHLRGADASDEFWVLEHYPVYTQGYACTAKPFKNNDIKVVATDRGGQITYHGPGQLVVYLLIDIRRRKLGIKNFITTIETSIMNLLDDYNIKGKTIRNAPGVYVNGKKIASLGIRISRGCSYHGLSLNVDMDTSPFENISPCGIDGLEVTSMKKLGVTDSLEVVSGKCVKFLARSFGYTCIGSDSL